MKKLQTDAATAKMDADTAAAVANAKRITKESTETVKRDEAETVVAKEV
jgi:hypothetical protein